MPALIRTGRTEANQNRSNARTSLAAAAMLLYCLSALLPQQLDSLVGDELRTATSIPVPGESVCYILG